MERLTAEQIAEARAVRILHGTLVGGLAVILGLFSLIVRRLSGPLLRTDETTGTIAWVLAGVALLDIALALLFFRSRLASPVQSGPPEAYWKAETRAPALLLWILFEGAGMIACVGYVLTGHSAPLAAVLIALLLLIWHAPGRLAGG
jgi:hypothetical protein